jgi:HlyD family secretion protein
MSQALTPSATPAWLTEAENEVPQASLRRVAWISLVTIVLGLGGILTWAALAHIDRAVPANGFVIASGKRKTISLLDGGILRELLVHEGDHVAAGQVLLRLDDIQVQAARAQANTQYWSAVAKATRLTAEALDQRELTFPDDLRQAASQDPAIAAAVAAEAHQFEVRWNLMDATVRVQDRKIAQVQAQIGAINAQIASSGTKLSLTREELRGVEYLLSRGLDTRPHQLDLLRTEADLRGQIGQLGNQLTQAQQQIAQTEFETINAAESRRADISKDRADTQAAQADAEQRLRAADDQLAKRAITAPEAGTITDIRYFTPGSSVVPGQPVMDLVPESSHLLIEGNVAPNDVEHLAIGQRVNVRLSAYKAHRVPVIGGRLVYVGADRQMDANNQPVFLMRAEVDADELKKYPGVVLLPGMPADVMVLNGRRSLLSFLISPITDSLFHAMNEE